MDALRELKLQENRLNYLHGESLFPKELNHVEASEDDTLYSIFKYVRVQRRVRFHYVT